MQRRDLRMQAQSEQHKNRKDYVEQLKVDYEMVFGSPAGKRVLKDILVGCNMYRSSFTSDPYNTAFNEGARFIGLHIQNMVEGKNKQKVKQERAVR